MTRRGRVGRGACDRDGHASSCRGREPRGANTAHSPEGREREPRQAGSWWQASGTRVRAVAPTALRAAAGGAPWERARQMDHDAPDGSAAPRRGLEHPLEARPDLRIGAGRAGGTPPQLLEQHVGRDRGRTRKPLWLKASATGPVQRQAGLSSLMRFSMSPAPGTPVDVGRRERQVRDGRSGDCSWWADGMDDDSAFMITRRRATSAERRSGVSPNRATATPVARCCCRARPSSRRTRLVRRACCRATTNSTPAASKKSSSGLPAKRHVQADAQLRPREGRAACRNPAQHADGPCAPLLPGAGWRRPVLLGLGVERQRGDSGRLVPGAVAR